jgi:hypothetical protein
MWFLTFRLQIPRKKTPREIFMDFKDLQNPQNPINKVQFKNPINKVQFKKNIPLSMTETDA